MAAWSEANGISSMRLILATLIAAFIHSVSCQDLTLLQNRSAPLDSSPLWFSSPPGEGLGTEADDGPSSQRLRELLARDGPNIRASSEYKDFKDIQANDSVAAWQLMRSRGLNFARNKVEFYRPLLDMLLRDANASVACRNATISVLDSIENLESWGIKIWNSGGNFPPIGLMDGQFTDLGSYRGCMDIKAPKLKSPIADSSVATRGQTSYCFVPFRPIVPSRKNFHMIFEGHQPLRDLFDRGDFFHELAMRAQYFHYLYWKTAVCVPRQCSPHDIQQVAKLISRRLTLMSGPVKCFTQRQVTKRGSGARPANLHSHTPPTRASMQRQPLLIEVGGPMNEKQVISFVIVSAFFGLVLLASLWHLAEMCLDKMQSYRANGHVEWADHNGADPSKQASTKAAGELSHHQDHVPRLHKRGLKYVAFEYFSFITNGREFLNVSMRPTEIRCLHGLRAITMFWIIIVHTLQFNDWSGFTRAFENESKLKDPILQPLFNANYVVDNFFFMSGLLAAYTIWQANKNSSHNFSALTCLVGRYLRLTPQVLLVSLLYILLPLIGDGPFWYDLSDEAARDCENNWWINLLHLQSFYKRDEICNLVGWWISVDMLYYLISLGVIMLILKGQLKSAISFTCALVGSFMILAARQHYQHGLTPNNLASVPQVEEVWSLYAVNFSWSPLPHAYPFFLGLWSGYMIANNKMRDVVRRWSCQGWILAAVGLLTVNLSSNVWISGRMPVGEQYFSTIYNNICSTMWATGFGWIVIACHYGCAKKLDSFLSTDSFILLSKASFIIYLSHMLIVRLYFGSQNTLVEVSLLALTYTLIGTTVLSIIFGVFLCISFEGPCMKFQRLAVQWLKEQSAGNSKSKTSYDVQTFNQKDNQKIAIAMESSTGHVLLK